jgi:glucose/arabinose dehydrogenase
LPTGYRLEVLLDGLALPTSIAATPDGRLLITEQETGRVRVVEDETLLDEAWFELPVYAADVKNTVQELGLVSVAVDPRFDEDQFVYIYYTEERRGGGRRTVLARLRDDHGRGTDLTELVSIELAAERRHIGGGIAFVGDTILLGVGDHERPGLAQGLDSLAGKVLRIDRDGRAPPGNPFVDRSGADPRVYAYGLRNPFGVATDRVTGRAFITENREVAGDALYELEAGADYGWPTHKIKLQRPLVVYSRPAGAAGAIVYRGSALPEFAGDVFFCTFHGGGALHWVEQEVESGTRRVDRVIAPACTSDVAEGADGFLYFLEIVTGKLIRISHEPTE